MASIDDKLEKYILGENLFAAELISKEGKRISEGIVIKEEENLFRPHGAYYSYNSSPVALIPRGRLDYIIAEAIQKPIEQKEGVLSISEENVYLDGWYDQNSQVYKVIQKLLEGTKLLEETNIPPLQQTSIAKRIASGIGRICLAITIIYAGSIAMAYTFIDSDYRLIKEKRPELTQEIEYEHIYNPIKFMQDNNEIREEAKKVRKNQRKNQKYPWGHWPIPPTAG